MFVREFFEWFLLVYKDKYVYLRFGDKDLFIIVFGRKIICNYR